MKSIKFTIAAILISIITHGQEIIIPKKAKQLKGILTLSKANTTISYPSDWEVDNSGLSGTTYIITTPATNDKDKFRENVSLLIQDFAPNNFTLDLYIRYSEQQIEKQVIKDAKIIESKRIKAGSDEYHRLVFTGIQENIPIKSIQIYRVVEKKAYILTFTAKVSTFDKYKNEGETILNSFEIGSKHKHE